MANHIGLDVERFASNLRQLIDMGLLRELESEGSEEYYEEYWEAYHTLIETLYDTFGES